jgi:osmotically-inducible protein OsmY
LSHNPSIRVCVEKNVVVLEGTVASAHDRILSAQLIALAPGVYAIDNRLKVAGADSPSP